MTQNEFALVFYTRLAIEGMEAKTRLGKEIGNQEFASQLAYHLICDLLEEYSALANCYYDFFVYYRGDLDEFKNKEHYPVTEYIEQLPGELSIQHIHKQLSEKYKKVIIVGSDIPFISREVILKAFIALNTHDAVMAPVEDGGYGLIGSNGFVDLYREITNWNSGTEGYRLAEETRAIAEKQNLKLAELDMLFDLDYKSDVEKMVEKVHESERYSEKYHYLKRTLEFIKDSKIMHSLTSQE